MGKGKSALAVALHGDSVHGREINHFSLLSK